MPEHLKRVGFVLSCFFVKTLLASSTQVNAGVLAAATGHIRSTTSTDQARIIKNQDGLRLQIAVESRTIDIHLPGSFVWSSSGITGLQLHDLTGNGFGDIICATSDGASIGAYISVFRVIAGDVSLISAKNEDAFEIEIVQSGAKKELALFGKWTEAQTATARALKWNGTALVTDQAESNRLFRARLVEKQNDVLAPRPQPPTLRCLNARTVFEVYIARSEYSDAAAFCTKLLRVLYEPTSLAELNRNIADLDGMGVKQPKSMIRVDQLQALSNVHKWLAEAYERVGDKASKDQELSTAAKLHLDSEVALDAAF